LSSETQRFEDAVGLFDLAISFSTDGEALAHCFADFVEFHGLTCYHYSRHLLRQSGLQIDAIMRFVYLQINPVVVLNTPEYGQSRSTRFEIEILENAPAAKSICIVELGGAPLKFQSHNLQRYSNLDSDIAFALVEIARRGAGLSEG